MRSIWKRSVVSWWKRTRSPIIRNGNPFVFNTHLSMSAVTQIRAFSGTGHCGEMAQQSRFLMSHNVTFATLF